MYGTTANPASLSLLSGLRNTTGGEDIGVFIYDTLVKLNSMGEIEPNIADIESDDGVTWTMTLQSGVEFSDGTALDAEAVKFNVETQADPENGAANSGLVAVVQEINVIDDTTWSSC